MVSRYLVTGHSGFIGRHIVTELARKDSYIRGLSRQITPVDNDAAVDARHGDITKPATLNGLMRGIDTVIHAAGHAHVTDSGHDHARLEPPIESRRRDEERWAMLAECT